MRNPFIKSTFPCLLLVLFLALHLDVSSQSNVVSDKVTITRKELVITRRGQAIRNLPHKKTATIAYPLISGLRDRTILIRVRSQLNVERVFNTSLKEYRESNWLDEFDYEVNYNANHILVISFWQVGSAAYVDSQSRTIPIDLKTGRIIKASDAFIVEKFSDLASAVNAKLKEEVAELVRAVKEDTSIADEDRSSIIKGLETFRFEVKNLDDFSINGEGVKFLYDAPDLPHVFKAFEPAGEYLFPYSTLKPFIKPSGPLAQFVK